MMMMSIDVSGEGAWPDLAGVAAAGNLIHLGNDAEPMAVVTLPGGMQSGKTSVMLRLNLPDGRVVVAETSLACFLAVAKIMQAAHPYG